MLIILRTACYDDSRIVSFKEQEEIYCVCLEPNCGGKSCGCTYLYFIAFRHIFVCGTSGGISTALQISLPVPDVQFRKEARCLDSKFEELNARVYGYATLVTF